MFKPRCLTEKLPLQLNRLHMIPVRSPNLQHQHLQNLLRQIIKGEQLYILFLFISISNPCQYLPSVIYCLKQWVHMFSLNFVGLILFGGRMLYLTSVTPYLQEVKAACFDFIGIVMVNR